MLLHAATGWFTEGDTGREKEERRTVTVTVTPSPSSRVTGKRPKRKADLSDATGTPGSCTCSDIAMEIKVNTWDFIDS